MSELGRLLELRSVLERSVEENDDIQRQFQVRADAAKKRKEVAIRDLRRVNNAIKREEKR